MKFLLNEKKAASVLIVSLVLSIFILPVVAAVIFSPAVASAQAQITISTSVPGMAPTTGTSGIGGFVANFYQFALMIGGVLAFGVVVYGGVKYMASAGNPSGQSDAKEWIQSALLGLALLVGAYFILSVINPQLLNLNLPSLTSVNIASVSVPGSTAGSTGGSTPSASTATGCAGSGCQNLASSGFACKPASEQPTGQASCAAAPEMITTLQCIENQPGIGSSDFTVTEAMPPTVPHESSCHEDGCCVDTALNNPTCAQVQALVNAAQACGTTAANEYAGCAGSTIYPTTQGGNVHINSEKGSGC